VPDLLAANFSLAARSSLQAWDVLGFVFDEPRL